MASSHIKIAFYKGGSRFTHKIIRWWTSSKYSHAELIMPDEKTWITISPFLNSKVTLNKRNILPNNPEWDFLELPLSWRAPVMEYQKNQLDSFVNQTLGAKYDWAGMLLSQVSPFLVKRANRWYCSEWIAHALVQARVLPWDYARIYDTPSMSPGKLYSLLKDYKPIYK